MMQQLMYLLDITMEQIEDIAHEKLEKKSMKSIEKKWGARPKLGAREDCFGYNKHTRQCEVMKETFCRYGDCVFYKESGTLCKGCQDKGNINICAACYELRGKYI